MTGLTFAEPQFIHGLWVVLLLSALMLGLERRGSSLLDRFIAPRMQSRLVDRPGDGYRALSTGLLCVAMLAVVVALMRPQWGFEFIEAPQVGAEIMVALDVSRSMLAEDVAPNRLERAKAELRDLLPFLGGDQVGLIAFAGRASVLCPLTPDFAFLRVVLDNVDVTSVSRGGTRLEEPIRKATAGFGARGDLSRVILLFTDGEDHDSFPLDAAKQAAERGIRIIVIGFGDENGSEIFVTDPDTGARTRIVDAGGRAVMSRLDGDLLRELALLTDGAYVPAGTGVLDLESIFEAHIRPLMRAQGEARGRTVQQDGFQWALLVALLALVGSTLSLLGGRGHGRLLLVALALMAPQDVSAAPSLSPPAKPATTQANDPAKSELRPRIRIPEEERDAYNAGVEALSSADLDEAERLLESARQDAGSDGELRYRATFNLAWVEIERSEAALESAPEEALARLERAADWLREAIALRPGDPNPRRNLEIILQRALVLADALAQKEGPDLATRLDELIEEQRGSAASIRGLIELVSVDPEAHLGASSKNLFKGAALEARTALSNAATLSGAAADELDGLRNARDDELSPEERMRIVQLESLLGYVHQARERIGQARSQLRRRQGVRAHRRAVAALSGLKRAREQLQNPVEILDGLARDTLQVASETRLLATASTGLRLSEPPGDGDAAPSWLDTEYLAETQQNIAERSSELDAKLLAGLDQGADPQDPEQLRLLELLRAAQPHVARATDQLVEGGLALDRERLIDASESQARALAALAEAREQFLDLKGLIEVAHGDETRIGGVLAQGESDPEIDLTEFGPSLAALQERNLERTRRMAGLVEQMRVGLEDAESGAGQDNEEAEAERQRLDLADGILAVSEASMRSAAEALERMADDALALDSATQSVASALKGLDGLRRLFFTLIEHLRDAGNQQLELGDETEIAPGLDAEDRGAEAQRLSSHQADLGEYTESLATALHDQSFADPAEWMGEEAAADPAAVEAATEKLVRASEFVLAAADEMEAAAEGIRGAGDEEEAGAGEETEPLGRSEIRELQDAAVHNILEALAILEPPSDEAQEDGEQGDSQEQEQQEGEAGEEAQPEEAEASADPGQLLQSVRDREAERHRRQHERGQSGYEPVDKDW